MRAAVTRKGRLIVDQVPDPIPAEGQLLVAPLATGICGSDLHALGDFDHFIELAASQGLDALDSSKDMIFGHEFCAEILENGPGTTGALPLGTRVCSIPLVFGSTGIDQIGYSHLYPGAMGERMILQEMFVLPVPDSVPTDLAALTEPLAVGEHAVGLADIEQGQPALVVGCGPVGLAVIAALRARGLGPIIAADFSPTRRSLAESFGVDEVIDPAELSPHSRWTEMGIPMTLMDRVMAQALGSAAPAPVIFEAVGIPGMIQSIVHDVPAGSRIVVVGVCMHSDSFEPFTAITKELELRFSFGYSGEEFAGTLARLETGVPGAAELVTSIIGLDEAPAAFAQLAAPGEQGKIIIHP